MVYKVRRIHAFTGKERDEVVHDVSRIAIEIPRSSHLYTECYDGSPEALDRAIVCDIFTWRILQNKIHALGELDLSEDADVIMFTYNTRIDAEYVIPLVEAELSEIRERRLSGEYVHPRYIQAMFSGEANIQWDSAESIRNSLHSAFSQTDSEQPGSFHIDDTMAALDEVLKPYGVAEIPYWDWEMRPDDYPPREWDLASENGAFLERFMLLGLDEMGLV